ncbi:hypothetical protein GWK47_027941 [Chionoecetes opilio]|uniref:Uncharacterized protein n=1 Tax=Chionoecetes opilio TaxID=41210 RepID=A0A8J4Z589_CHIOP|nr:hypothetical protein GWK47_027941 [Chionoecetes opilio]
MDHFVDACKIENYSFHQAGPPEGRKGTWRGPLELEAFMPPLCAVPGVFRPPPPRRKPPTYGPEPPADPGPCWGGGQKGALAVPVYEGTKVTFPRGPAPNLFRPVQSSGIWSLSIACPGRRTRQAETRAAAGGAASTCPKGPPLRFNFAACSPRHSGEGTVVGNPPSCIQAQRGPSCSGTCGRTFLPKATRICGVRGACTSLKGP